MALPTAADFTDASTTEAEFKTAITDQRNFLAGLLGTDGVAATALSTIKALGAAANARTSGAYTIVAADRGKVIHVTGSTTSAFTLPVTTTTDFGIGFSCIVRNDSTQDLTLTRSSTDTIDATTAVVITPGTSCIIAISAAGKWVTIGYTSLATVMAILGGTSATKIPYAALEAPVAGDTYVLQQLMPPELADVYMSTGAGWNSKITCAYISPVDGSIRVKAECKKASDGTIYFRVEKNGTLVTQTAIPSTSYSTISIDVSCTLGDRITAGVYSASSSRYGLIQDLRVTGTKKTLSVDGGQWWGPNNEFILPV